MASLEDVGGSPGGAALRAFLEVAHNENGTLKPGSEVGSLDVIAGSNPTAADVAMNGHGLTGLSGATSQTDQTISVGAGGASGNLNFNVNGTTAASFIFGSAGPPDTRGTFLFNHGDALNLAGQGVTTGRWLDIRQGTSASPDAGLVPPIKVSRTISDTFASISGDGSEQLAGITSSVLSVAGSEVQPVGVYAEANQDGTTADSADAVGMYGVAKITSSSAGTGTAIPLFLYGQKNYSGQRISAAQITAWNNSGVAETWSVSTPNSCLIEVFPFTGSGKIAAGIQFNASTGHLDVGLGFHAGGYMESASIRDDSSSPRSIYILGSHTIGIDLSAGTFSGSAIALPNSTGLVGLDAAGTANRNLIKINSSDQTEIGDGAGGLIVLENDLYTGAKNIVTDTTTGTSLGTGVTQKVGAYGFKAVQPSGADQAAITDSTGGTKSLTFAAITAGASYAQADMVAVKNALAQIAATLNAHRTALVNTGWMKGSA